MELKILLTGKNRRIAGNISEHLSSDKGYRVVSCGPGYDAIFRAIPQEQPHIAIICLGDEERETIKIYDALTDRDEIGQIEVIVVANKADLKIFKEYIKLDGIRYLPRPVSILELYNLLNDIEKKIGPRLQKARKEETKKERETEHNYGIRRKRILVVDDDAEQLSQIKGNLEEFYDVTPVRSGFDALKYLEKHEVDLVLLDYIMPVMDGAKVLYRLRTTRAHASLPVIFLTGMTERDKVVKTLVELRPQGYIVKPAKKSEIVAKIIDVLG